MLRAQHLRSPGSKTYRNWQRLKNGRLCHDAYHGCNCPSAMLPKSPQRTNCPRVAIFGLRRFLGYPVAAIINYLSVPA
eukprot:6062668-Amphidinium_carterae.2